MNIGKTIRAVRQLRGMKQFQLARRARLRVTVLCRTEKGRTSPTWRTVAKLMRVLRIDLLVIQAHKR